LKGHFVPLLDVFGRNAVCDLHSIVKIMAPPPTICQKCGSHRTRIVGESVAPKVVYVRCEACGHVFVPPPPQAEE
jgi:uncharacterized OB-fold protein